MTAHSPYRVRVASSKTGQTSSKEYTCELEMMLALRNVDTQFVSITTQFNNLAISIKYDWQKGTADAESVTKNVTTSYSSLAKPVQQVIPLVVKVKLLERLTELNDKEISGIIHNNHPDLNSPTPDVHEGNLEQTLLQLQKNPHWGRLFSASPPETPLKNIVGKILNDYGFDRINTMEDVARIIAEIDVARNQNQQSMHSPSITRE